MNGRELADALKRASPIDIDDVGDELARDVRGREIIGQLNKRLHIHAYGHPPLLHWDSVKLKKRKP